MEILKGVDIIGLGLFLKKSKTLILGDFHIGQEEEMNRQGVLIPRFQFKELCDETIRILVKAKSKVIVLNGDLKHVFGTISVEEWRNVLRYIELIEKNTKDAKIIIIEGNHDRVLAAIARKKNIELVDYYLINDKKYTKDITTNKNYNNNSIYICHGHEIPKDESFKKAKTVIIGHEHPAISLRDGNRMEKYKCFLKGKFKGKTLIVMPSMSTLSEGTDILQEKLLSPFLKRENLRDFEATIIGEKPYHFGKLRDIVKLS